MAKKTQGEPHNHAGHRNRLKERYIKTGLGSFENHQILELLLFYTYPRVDTNEIAHKMINEFGSLTNLLEAEPLDIVEKCKVTQNVAILISLILPIYREYLSRKLIKAEKLDSVSKAASFAKSLFIGVRDERSYLLSLNFDRKIISAALLSEGDEGEVAFHPKKLAAEAIRAQAHSIIITHNHPSGSARPSSADLQATKLIKDILAPLHIELLDHIIVAGEAYYSFCERKNLDTVY